MMPGGGGGRVGGTQVLKMVGDLKPQQIRFTENDYCYKSLLQILILRLPY